MVKLFDREKTVDIMRKVYGDVREIDSKVTFLAFLGLLADQWAVDHGVTDEEVEQMLEALWKASKEVHDVNDRLDPTMVEVDL
jgi:CRISPR/Cas system type I-B associated protein Csh2 (Cas7 group RAMP superfamily)